MYSVLFFTIGIQQSHLPHKDTTSEEASHPLYLSVHISTISLKYGYSKFLWSYVFERLLLAFSRKAVTGTF